MSTFLQLNMHKASAASAEINKRAIAEKLDIFLLTEPYSVKNKVVTLPKNYQLFPVSPQEHTPRAAILVRNHFTVVHLDHLSNSDCTVVLIKQDQLSYMVASVYLDITKDPIPSWLIQISEYAESKHYPLILGVDSNAHSEIFGSPTTNPWGEAVEDFIIEHGLDIANEGTTPTFETLRLERCISFIIDITLTRSIAVHNWRVDQSFNGSDHNSILFNIEARVEEKTRIRPWKKCNWGVFSQVLNDLSLIHI